MTDHITQPAVDGCPFCPDNWRNLKVVDQSHPDGIVIEPLNPVTTGHVLVIGAGHAESAAADPVQAGCLMRVAASYVQRKGIAANIVTSIGSAATQTVFHTHLHVVPRRVGDGLPLPWTPQKLRPRPGAVVRVVE